MGLVGQVQDDALLRLNTAGAVLGLDKAAGHVGVHAVAGDVLADLIHHQHVALVKQQVGDGLVGDLLELGFLADDLLRAQALDEIGIVIGVFNDGNAAQNRRVFQNRPAVLLHQLMHDGRALMMDALSALLLAKADGHHLHQAAFIGAAEGGVGLDAVVEDDAVSLRGILIHIYRLMTYAGNADLHRLHGAFHGAAHGLLRNAVILEDLELALGGSAAVAAHSRHNVRLGALGLDKVHNGTGHHGIVIDAAAAAGNGDLLTGLDLAADLRAIQLPGDDAGNIALRDAGLVEVLANLDHLGDRCVFDQVGNGFHVLLLSRRRRRHIVSTSIQIFNLKTDAVGCSPQHRARQDHSWQHPIPVPRDTPGSSGDAFHTCSVGLHSSCICFSVPCTCTSQCKKKSETISLINTVSIICVRFFCNYKI